MVINETGKDADEGPEKLLQEHCEAYLDLMGLRYTHVPENLQRYLRQQAPPHIARFASEAFKGVPDLLIFDKLDAEETNTMLAVELKSKTGTLSQGQKNWHKGLNVHIIRSFDTFKELIKRTF